MDTALIETLARIERAVQDNASAVQAQEQQLRLLVAGQAEIIKKLTSEPKDGPSLDELIGHMIGQLSGLTGYVRQIVASQSDMEQNLPGDVARAIAAGAPISIVTIEGKPKVLMTSRTWELNDGQPEKDNPEAYADDLAAAAALIDAA